MTPSKHTFSQALWWTDVAAMAVNTWVGFASHGEATQWTRMPSTFVPLLVAWTLAALPLGLFTPAPFTWRRALRILWAALLAGPLAAVLRALWLNTTALPVFALVLSAFTALFVALGRGLLALATRHRAGG